ncbi:hypothetical protein Pth03_82900 [Planotetraspora thailandica]|uniref:Uncharacterized protein n=1 Tax=Planotetraspora thailandica TaxID=487172 RepID=A0A8J3Y368_9ACTN|nr:hypothetical protein [Planotetraspora thailandica]GII59901.1 hypothetical protein Pth03_82900 [Planotetraspora thailandica]
MWKAIKIFGFIVGAYAVARALVEPLVIDMSDPATYQGDWGGPSLGGVLLAHCGPGVVAAVVMIWALLHRRSRLRGGTN